MTDKKASPTGIRWTKWLAILIGLGLIGIGSITLLIVFFILPSLPDVETLKNVQYQVPMSVFSRDGKLIAQFGEKKRTPVHYDEIPQRQIHAFLAAEDNRFFEHRGVDFLGLARAASQLIMTGEKRQGGSTITMQVARNFFLTRKKTYTRKLREIILSYKIENELTKEEILALYLNKIYLGHRSYGVAAAASVYYGKPLDQLSLAQQAMIAGLPKAPSSYNPLSNAKRALLRRNYILNRMLALGYITAEEHEVALNEPISATAHNVVIELEAPYIAEMVRNEMLALYGEDIYTDGLQVITSIDSRLQIAANRALRSGLHDYDRRHGYRGILNHVDLPETIEEEGFIETTLASFSRIGETRPALILAIQDKAIEVALNSSQTTAIDWEDLKWAQPYISETQMGAMPKTPSDIFQPGDIIRVRTRDDGKGLELSQVPQVAGALVAVDPFDGSLKALIGGYDFYDSKFNRAYQAKRQPGSGFKPFLYLAALEKGYTPATIINDAPVVFQDSGLEAQWRPENYSGKFFGPTRLREALTHSRNLVSIRILRDIGIDYVLESTKRFFFEPGALPRNLSLALGSGSATPFQMASNYAVLANGGYRIEPYFIDRITNRDRELVLQSHPSYACDACPEAVAAWQNRKPPETKSVASSDSDSDLSQISTVDPTLSEDESNGIDAPEPPQYAERVIAPQDIYQLTSLLQNVVQNGTAQRAKSLGRTDLAGKTGTTNEQRDAWFNGFQQHMAATAWVGFDDARPLGSREVGGRAALPIWIDFMRVALQGIPESSPDMPPDMVTVRIDADTGERATAETQNAIFEVFRKAYAPKDKTNQTFGGSSGSSKSNSRTLQQLF